ncbi:hypothetical protein KSP40_PGU011455 [Platanthera guangdongensis]|uniref:F-box domain-containing protein n=1 Tax=Platanthera guangdongensis TaxID=2320717 RepID=A0ABR2MKR4_9ASPA
MSSPSREPSWSSIPDDIALTIVSLLEAIDVCSLGSCSRFWRGICVSDLLWMRLAKRRWPMLFSAADPRGSFQILGVFYGLGDEISQNPRLPVLPSQGWREGYIYKHQSLAASVSIMKGFVKQCIQSESLEVGHYLEAVNYLHSYQLGFMDVQMFLFSKCCSALLNLVGLHYCLHHLEIPPGEVAEALSRSQVSEREICVRWFKLGRWFFGFRLPNEQLSRNLSLGELVMDKGNEVLQVLNRGAVHEVIRVHIGPAIPMPSCSRAGSEN